MIRTIGQLFLCIFLAACQVEGDVRPAKKVDLDAKFLQFKVVLPEGGWIRNSEPLEISLRYPYDVDVKGFPYIELVVGSETRRAYYSGGSGTQFLKFRYFVTSTDYDVDGVTLASQIDLTDSSMEYRVGNKTYPVSTILQSPNTIVRVDGGLPSVTSIVGPVIGRYQTGQNLDYVLNFTENVYVTGTVSFDIDLFSGSVPVTYLSGSGTTRLVFRRKILSSDLDEDGFSTGGIIDQDSSANRGIKDQSGNYISSTIPAVSTYSVINSTGPIITSLTPPSDATFVAGENLDFLVDFDQPVEVEGSPTLNLELTTGTVVANFTGGSGTTRLTFQHTVQPGEHDMDGLNLEQRIHLNGGLIKQVGSVLSAATVFSAPDTSGLLINAFNGPSVFYHVLPNPKVYTTGDVLEFSLGFNRSVTVTGTPQLEIYVGPTPRTVYADYRPELSTNFNLFFRYTVTGADADPDGITLHSPLNLNGGTILDENFLTPANLHFSVPDASGAKIVP